MSIERIIIPSISRPLSGSAEIRLFQKVLGLIKAEKLNLSSNYTSTQSKTISFGDRLFLHRDHHLALVSWGRALDQGKITKGAVVWHADRHPDLGTYKFPIFKIDPRQNFLHNTTGLIAEIDRYPQLLPENIFIQPAASLGIIGKYVHIVDPTVTPSTALKEHYPKDIANIDIISLTDFAHRLPVRRSNNIFDLDVDLFCYREQDRVGNLEKDLTLVLRGVQTLQPEIITVALSPLSSDAMHRYSTLTDEQATYIVTSILIAQGWENLKINFYEEPRRKYVESDK